MSMESRSSRSDVKVPAAVVGCVKSFPPLLFLFVYQFLQSLERHALHSKLFDVKFLRIVILKRVEDLQLEVESSQKKLNITKPETFRSVLHDIASNMRMDYLLGRTWSNLDRQRSRIMIKTIYKLMLERRLMRSLENFVSGRDYEEHFRLLEKTI
nr:hypothetical protein [Tanacetum cinerariifolium]